MSAPNEDIHQIVEDALRSVVLPYGLGLTASDAVAVVKQADNGIYVQLELGYPIDRYRETLRGDVKQALSAHFNAVDLDISWRSANSQAANTQTSIPGVKNIIAVASGKGGVGKSTTSVNVALSLAHQGAKVGVLDADIYGPSQAQMLGVADKRPQMHRPNMMEPITTHFGIQMVSMGNLVTEDTPMVWRGPMVSGALQQLLTATHWVDLDYLIIDMPPGTGDIQLTLSQSVPVSGALIVTTPQDIALLDAKKGIEMFRKVHIPVLGVVENMSTHICSNCGHQEAIFGEGGGDQLASEYGVEVLGRLPLALSVRKQTDEGKPPVFADPESDISELYHQIAAQVTAGLWQKELAGSKGPNISFADD